MKSIYVFPPKYYGGQTGELSLLRSLVWIPHLLRKSELRASCFLNGHHCGAPLARHRAPQTACQLSGWLSVETRSGRFLQTEHVCRVNSSSQVSDPAVWTGLLPKLVEFFTQQLSLHHHLQLKHRVYSCVSSLPVYWLCSHSVVNSSSYSREWFSSPTSPSNFLFLTTAYNKTIFKFPFSPSRLSHFVLSGAAHRCLFHLHTPTEQRSAK